MNPAGLARQSDGFQSYRRFVFANPVPLVHHLSEREMVVEAGSENRDSLGVAEYRIDAGFVIGYVALFAGLWFFGWDPRYVFLGLAIEIALANVGLIVRAFLTARGSVVAIGVTTMLCLPALLVSLGFAAMPGYRIATDGDFDSTRLGWTLFAGFLVSILYSEGQRFRRVTLPQARFTRYFDEKYVFENGKRVFTGSSHVLSSVVASWLLTGVFAVSWGVASVFGAIEDGDGDLLRYSATSAVVLVSLCLLRQLITIGIVRLAYRNRPSQEELWLKTFSQAGKIVLRRGDSE